MDRRQFRQFIDFIDTACCYKRSVVYVCVTDTAYADRIDAAPGVSLSVCPSERTDRGTDNRPMQGTAERRGGQCNKPIGGSSPSRWQGPRLIFRVRGEARRTEARGSKGRLRAGILGDGEASSLPAPRSGGALY